MLRSVIEDYLESIKEVQFFLPFMQLLEACQYYDIHLIHGSSEFGKDVIAKKVTVDSTIQYFFQIKVGDINSKKFRIEVKPQLMEAVTNRLSHPNFNKELPFQIMFVTTGKLIPPATLSFQEFNSYLSSELGTNEIEVWERDKLISDFANIGLEPFFSIHKSPSLIGKFFDFYSKITNGEPLDSFEIEYYTRFWLDLDWAIVKNRLQVFFESFLFSKLLSERERSYESILVLTALIRVLCKNNLYQEYRLSLLEHVNDILESFFAKFDDYDTKGAILLSECKGLFSIFYYPANCLRTLELFALYFLTNGDSNTKRLSTFRHLLTNERGSEHPISDNYAVSVVMITLALIKNDEVELAKKYVNNVTIWLCDRYEEIGLSSVGASLQEEIEQLLSENLEGFQANRKRTSFIASALLDISYLIGDSAFYADVANDLRACSIIPEYYHVLNTEALFTYEHPSIVSTHDFEFSLEMVENYSKIVRYERKANQLKRHKEELIFLAFLLRDRYFPTLLKSLI